MARSDNHRHGDNQRSSSNQRARRPHHSNRNAQAYRQSIRVQDDDFSYISPCVKYSLFFFNFVFWVIGVSFIGLGTWSVMQEYNETSSLVNIDTLLDAILHISLSLIIVGMIIFIMSFAGCLGALRENLCLLRIYSLLLLILFTSEISISTVAFMFPNSFSTYLKDILSKDPIIKYRDDKNLQNLIDKIQTEFKCCGISDKGYKDWFRNEYYNCTPTNKGAERCGVPYSCCRNPKNIDSGLNNIMCGYNVQNISSVVEVNKSIYTRGCIEAATEIFERNMNIVAGVCLGSAIIQLLAMFLARSLQGQIMAQRARWM